MDQPESRTPNQNEIVAKALAATKQANEMRGAAIEQLLAQRVQIEEDLKTLGYDLTAPRNGNGFAPKPDAHGDESEPSRWATRVFKDLSLAETAQKLLMENKILHGKEIERLALAGGFKSNSTNFQNYLPVALRRAGGFENVGQNRWRLNPAIPPKRQ